MLRVSKLEARLSRPRDTEHASPGPRPGRTQGGCVIIRSGGRRMGGLRPPVPTGGHEDCRRSGGDQQPGVSGPSSGAQALRLHLVMIPPGTRGTPHFHADHETAIYLVSGKAEVWHGKGLARRSAVRAGDFIYIPPGTEHLAVNRGDVTSIAVVARTDAADTASAIVVELPRHLDDVAGIPVAVRE